MSHSETVDESAVCHYKGLRVWIRSWRMQLIQELRALGGRGRGPAWDTRGRPQ